MEMTTITIHDKKCRKFLVAAVLLLSMATTAPSVLIVHALQPKPGDYIVTEWEADALSRVDAGGVRTVLYTFPHDTVPAEFVIDPSGNYIVAEYAENVISKITPLGARNVIYSYTFEAGPDGIVVDPQGDYIVAESVSNTLSKITFDGARTVIFDFAPGTYPAGVAIDSQGNYIVTEADADVLSKITSTGVRTVIYSFAPSSWPDGVVIDSQGRYIVTEYSTGVLSRITPGGVRSVICTFPLGAGPDGVTIDLEGNYVVTEYTANRLSRITPGGARSVLHEYDAGTGPEDVEVVKPVRATLSAFDLLHASNFVRLIYPSDSVPKPLGCGAASVSDWLASMAVSTKLRNFTEGLDTMSGFVDQTTGKPFGASEVGIVSFGGPYVNPVVKYAESEGTDPADRAPIKFYDNWQAGLYSFQYRNGTNIPGASLPSSVIQQDEGEDMFVIEVYTDGGGRFIMLCYGFGWKGTYAAGKFFHSTVYSDLDSFRVGWIVVKWEDTDGNGFVNGPGDGDTYMIVAADPISLITVYSEAASNKPHSGGSWVMVDDPSSPSGKVMKAGASSSNGDFLFGPYITEESGGQTMSGRRYLANFRLKVSSNISPSDVIYVDVTCNFGTVLNSMRIKANDFASSNVWQDFQLSFTAPASMTSGLEFRINNLNSGVADVFANGIKIMR
jgi:DNA-binding beta-propeller fold protein YncE